MDVAEVVVHVKDVCVLLADVELVDVLDRVCDVIVLENSVEVEDVVVRLFVVVVVVDVHVPVVVVETVIVVGGQAFCSFSQHHCCFFADQAISQFA